MQTYAQDEFPLDFVSFDLQSVILEKMNYIDFASFNQCSDFSVAMCRQLSKNGKLPFSVYKLSVDRKPILFRYEFRRKRQTLDGCSLVRSRLYLDIVPFNVLIQCETLQIFELNQIELSLLKIRRIQAQILVIGTPHLFITEENLKNILVNTEAKELQFFGICEPFFYLPEVQKLQKISACCLSVPEDCLLKLESPTIFLEPRNRSFASLIEQNGVYKFLMQWVRHERRIEDFAVFFNSKMDMAKPCYDIETNSNATTYKPERHETYWISRGVYSDFLRLNNSEIGGVYTFKASLRAPNY